MLKYIVRGVEYIDNLAGESTYKASLITISIQHNINCVYLAQGNY